MNIDNDEGYESDEQSEELQKKEQLQAKKLDLAKVFNLPSGEAVNKGKTVKKISSDDVSIMRQLINKYGDDINVSHNRTLFICVVKPSYSLGRN